MWPLSPFSGKRDPNFPRFDLQQLPKSLEIWILAVFLHDCRCDRTLMLVFQMSVNNNVGKIQKPHLDSMNWVHLNKDHVLLQSTYSRKIIVSVQHKKCCFSNIKVKLEAKRPLSYFQFASICFPDSYNKKHYIPPSLWLSCNLFTWGRSAFRCRIWFSMISCS